MNSRAIWTASAILVLLLGWGFFRGRHASKTQASAQESQLYTGKEPLRKVELTFPSKDRPGFVTEEFQIFATPGLGAQLKQVLLLLFKGPKGAHAATAFPGGWQYREVFLTDQGLAVVDLDPADIGLNSGGTSAEYISLYTLVKSLTENFKEVKKVQLLVGGEARESLAGHLDISQPLSPQSF